MKCCIGLTWCLFMSTLVALIAFESQGMLLKNNLSEDPTVETTCGKVRGTKSKGINVFKGIPYALPPTGGLRWQPPVQRQFVSHTCWIGTYNANKFGSSCVQPKFGSFSEFQGSEDCLYINVWSPTLDPKAKLTVMVWIHGGFLLFASGNYPLYSPTEELARDTNMVYVSMNYRLNAFGFMALDILSKESITKTSGNYGFMDQILALEWIKYNIGHFGGDSNSVTVYGQSSGGTSLFALLASPGAQGLFHRAWLMSASPVLNKTLADASRDNLAFLKNTNCSDVACLRKMTATQVSNATPWFKYPFWAMSDQNDLPEKNHFDGALAIVDGVVLPKSPFDMWKDESGFGVPTITGTTAQETDFGANPPNINTWKWTDYAIHVQKKLGTFGADIAKQALDLYPLNFTVTPEYQYTSMGSDLRVTCPNDIMATKASESFKSNVWRYVVTSCPSVPIHPLGDAFPSRYAFHMWDFIAFSGFIPNYILSPTVSDIAFQDTIRREILSFVRTGKVNNTLWYPFPSVTAVLSGETEILTGGFHPTKCNFWTKNNFFSYAWIN